MAGAINVHNDPVICCSVATAKGDTFRTSTIYTKDERHTADNRGKNAEEVIKYAMETLGCKYSTTSTEVEW